MQTLRLISFNLRQRLKRFKYILKRTTGELRRAVWCLQEAKGLKGLAAMGYAVVKPEVESDLLLAAPKHLQPQVGHSVISHRRWMACQLGSLLVANVHWPVARATTTMEMEGLSSPWWRLSYLGLWATFLSGAGPSVGTSTLLCLP